MTTVIHPDDKYPCTPSAGPFLSKIIPANDSPQPIREMREIPLTTND